MGKISSYYQKMVAIVAFVLVKVTQSALLIVFFSAAISHAGLAVRNVNPFAQGVGLPTLMDGRLLEFGQMQYALNGLWSSHFSDGSHGDEGLFIDGESLQFDLYYRYRFQALELAINIPFVKYSGGQLDNAVDLWHDTFNLPDGGRKNFSNDQLSFNYGLVGSGYHLNDDYQGLGDIRLSAGFQIAADHHSAHSVYLHAKIPTAKSVWLSSGGTDVAVLLSHQYDSEIWKKQLQYGVIYLGDGDWLQEKRRNWAVTVQGALAYWWSKNLELIGQVDSHSALFHDSRENQLGFGLILSLGFAYHWQQSALSFALIEDLKPESAVDVGFLLGFKQSFD